MEPNRPFRFGKDFGVGYTVEEVMVSRLFCWAALNKLLKSWSATRKNVVF